MDNLAGRSGTKRKMLVPEAGIEPAWSYPRGFLRPVRLPIPPLRLAWSMG